jgi:DHA2 family multidrug resistance protein
VTASSQAAVDRMQGMTSTFMHRGFAPVQAREMALRALDGIVERQATLLAFNKVFLLAGIAFLFVLPLLYFLKVPDEKTEEKKEKIEVHME